MLLTPGKLKHKNLLSNVVEKQWFWRVYRFNKDLESSLWWSVQGKSSSSKQFSIKLTLLTNVLDVSKLIWGMQKGTEYWTKL